MADADEDFFPHSYSTSSATGHADPSADLDDEAQDFRFLAALTSSKSTPGPTLPKRGEKDFEPNPTQAQSNTLAASREAMHKALSVERVLFPRNPLVGQYLPDSRDWRWDVMPAAEGGKGSGGRCVVVEKFNTTYARSMGVADYRNWTWLLPEEALFLLERGSLDVRWPDDNVRAFMKGSVADENNVESQYQGGSTTGSQDEESDEENQNNVDIEILVKDENSSTEYARPKHVPLQTGEMPMSLQGAYASFIGKSGLTLERYYVYTGLRRLGYILQRAPTWDAEDDTAGEQRINGDASEPTSDFAQLPLPPSTTTSNTSTSLINRLVSYLYTPQPPQYNPSHGPLIYPGLYTNYLDIFRALTLIPHNAAASTAPLNPQPPFTIAWQVYKPSPNQKFRKSSPPKPDFLVAVVDARTTSIPTASQLTALLDSMPADELPAEKRMEARLKHGKRSVMLAVVDCGLASYLRVADMVSATEGRLVEMRIKNGEKAKRSHWANKGGRSRGGRGKM